MKSHDYIAGRTWTTLLRNSMFNQAQTEVVDRVLPLFLRIYPDYLTASFGSIHVMRWLFQDFHDGQCMAEEVRRISRLFLPHLKPVVNG